MKHPLHDWEVSSEWVTDPQPHNLPPTLDLLPVLSGRQVAAKQGVALERYQMALEDIDYDLMLRATALYTEMVT